MMRFAIMAMMKFKLVFLKIFWVVFIKMYSVKHGSKLFMIDSVVYKYSKGFQTYGSDRQK